MKRFWIHSFLFKCFNEDKRMWFHCNCIRQKRFDVDWKESRTLKTATPLKENTRSLPKVGFTVRGGGALNSPNHISKTPWGKSCAAHGRFNMHSVRVYCCCYILSLSVSLRIFGCHPIRTAVKYKNMTTKCFILSLLMK